MKAVLFFAALTTRVAVAQTATTLTPASATSSASASAVATVTGGSSSTTGAGSSSAASTVSSSATGTGSSTATDTGSFSPSRTVGSTPTQTQTLVTSSPTRSPTRSPSIATPTLSVTRTPVAAGAQPAGMTRQLMGRFLRIGVNSVGTLGSVGNAPPGIQVDYDGNGFFQNAYDFLTPGTPWEGWSVKIGSPGVIHSNNNAESSNVNGLLYIYSGVTHRNETWDNRAVWVGTAPQFTIRHDVRFNRDDDVISIVTELTATVALSRVFFARFTDPDAKVSPGDASTTRNVRGWGPIPPSNIVLSETLFSGYTQGLMSPQQGGVGTGVTNPWATDPEAYFPGATSRPVGDDAIGIGFSLGDVPAGQTRSVAYSYIFGTGLFMVDKSVTAEPARGSLLGGTLVSVTPGMSLNASSAALLWCRWGSGAVGDLSELVPATYASNTSATCAAPVALKLGPATLWFSATGPGAGGTWGYIGQYTYVEPGAGGLPPLLLQPAPGSGSADGGALLWPPAPAAPADAPAPLSLSLSWLLTDSELFAVNVESLYYSVELFELLDPLGTAAAWAGAAGPRYAGAGSGSNSALPPVTPAVQAALAAAEHAAHAALLGNGTAISSQRGARLLGSVDTTLLGFGMAYSDRAPDGGDGVDVSAFWVAPLPLNASSALLAVRPVFVRLTARDATAGGRPLFVRSSSLRWLLHRAPADAPAPGASASGAASPPPRGTPLPVDAGASFDAHAACAAWKALRRDPATWNRGLPQCPQSLAQLPRALWVPRNDCSGRNGTVAWGGAVVVDAWGTAPCWAHRGRAAFGEPSAHSCFVSAVSNAAYAGAACCYDVGGRLLRAGAGAAADARFAPNPGRLSHVFADALPRVVCCALSNVREDCDGVVRAGGGFSWRGAGGAAGDPHFISLDGAQLAFNGAGDFVYLGVKSAPTVPTPRIASLPAAPGRPWGAPPAGVAMVSVVRLIPLSLLYAAGAPTASAIRGWACVTAGGEHVSVAVRGGQLQVHVNGSQLPLWSETSGFVDAFYARSAFARTRGALTALSRAARFGAGNGTAAAAADAAARAALASRALDASDADATWTLGNVTVVFSRARRRVLVTLPLVGVSVAISQVRSNVSALDGALLHLEADAGSELFNRTFGLLGDFDGSAANDLRSHGGAGGSSGGGGDAASEAAAFAAVTAQLQLTGVTAAFPDALPGLTAPFAPVFAGALPAPDAVGAGGAPLLAACGLAPNASSVADLPFAQVACYLDGSVTGAPDVGASTLALVRELQAASAAAGAAAPELVAPPANLSLVAGATAAVTLTALVPGLLPGSPAAAAAGDVAWRVEASPSGGCSIGSSSGVLVCGPLALSAAGLTPAADDARRATGGVVIAASTRATGATTLHLLLLLVEAAAPSASGSATGTSSGSLSATPSSSPPTVGASASAPASSLPSSSLQPASATATALGTSGVAPSVSAVPRNESALQVGASATAPATGGAAAGGALLAALVVAVAACWVHRRRRSAAAPKAAAGAGAARGDLEGGATTWHNNKSLGSLPPSAFAGQAGGSSSGGGGRAAAAAAAANPLLLAQFASTRRAIPGGSRPATQRASFAPTAAVAAAPSRASSSRTLVLQGGGGDSQRSLQPATAAVASPSPSTRQLLLLAQQQQQQQRSPSPSSRRLDIGGGGSGGHASPSASSRSLLLPQAHPAAVAVSASTRGLDVRPPQQQLVTRHSSRRLL